MCAVFSNITVSEGGVARLTCAVGHQVGDCEWTRDGFALGADKQLPSLPRYTMDNCDLVIQPVLPLDEGLYQCQVSVCHGVMMTMRVYSGERVSLSVRGPVQGGEHQCQL